MRVFVMANRLGPLSPLATARAVGAAFEAQGAEVVAVGSADAGEDLATALDEVGLGRVASAARADLPDGVLPTASTAALGRAARALHDAGEPVVVDLSAAQATHDAGAGILAAFGARADVPLDQGREGLHGLTTVDLSELVRPAGVVGLIDPAQDEDALLGLRGLSSMRAHRGGLDHAHARAVDADLEALVSRVDADAATVPGAGAAGGAAWAILALGGRLTTAPAFIAERLGLASALDAADVLVAVVDELTPVERGGALVGFLAVEADARGLPLIVVAGWQPLSARELRTFGVEEAFQVGRAIASPAELTSAATPAARAWRW